MPDLSYEEITRKLKRRNLAQKVAKDPMAAAALLESLFNDIDSMKVDTSHETVESFGPFAEAEEYEDGVYIEWPNLGIMLEKLEKFLQP